MIPLVLGLTGLFAKVAAVAAISRPIRALREVAAPETGLTRNQIVDHNEDYGATTQIAGDAGVYNPYRYTGQEWDAELGMYNLRARHYSPSLGRFLARDPIGYAGGSNLMAYCQGDPVDFTDSTGTIIDVQGSQADVRKLNCALSQIRKTAIGTTLLDALQGSATTIMLRQMSLTGHTVNGLAVPNTPALNEWSRPNFAQAPNGHWFLNMNSFFLTVDFARVASEPHGVPLDVILLHELGHTFQALFHADDWVSNLHRGLPATSGGLGQTQTTRFGHVVTTPIEAYVIDNWEDPYRAVGGLPYRNFP